MSHRERRERPAPSPDELKELFSLSDSNTSITDGLVYTALGFYEDNDYVGLARVAADLGGVEEFARAEARLEIILERYDGRKPGYAGYIEDSNVNLDRMAGVDGIVSSLSLADADRFFEVYEAEVHKLAAEQLRVDNGISD